MSQSKSSESAHPLSTHTRALVLVVILAVFIALVCGGHGMSAAISAIAACGLLAEEISRRLGWITGPQSA